MGSALIQTLKERHLLSIQIDVTRKTGLALGWQPTLSEVYWSASLRVWHQGNRIKIKAQAPSPSLLGECRGPAEKTPE
jgi:hypothetical protein